MIYMLRRKDGSVEPASAGTLVLPDGMARHLKLADISVSSLDRWKSPKRRGIPQPLENPGPFSRRRFGHYTFGGRPGAQHGGFDRDHLLGRRGDWERNFGRSSRLLRRVCRGPPATPEAWEESSNYISCRGDRPVALTAENVEKICCYFA